MDVTIHMHFLVATAKNPPQSFTGDAAVKTNVQDLNKLNSQLEID